MRQKLANFFKEITIFDYIILFFTLTTILVVSIVFKCDALSIIYSVIGLFAIFSLSKGLFFSPILLILTYIIYATQSYLGGLYGEAILNIFILIPIQAYTMINWLIKHKKSAKKTNKAIINKIHWKEWLFVLGGYLLILVASYFILRALKTNYLILSTLSFAGAILANYLTMRGTFYQFVVYLANNVVLILMWLMPLIEGSQSGTNFLPIVVSLVAFTLINIYGLINWIKLDKEFSKKIENGKDSENMEENMKNEVNDIKEDSNKEA